MSSWLRDVLLYRYYDTPEDRDCGKKIVYLARSSCLLGKPFSCKMHLTPTMVSLIGGFVGIHDVIANRHMIPSQTYTGWAIRGLSTAVPFGWPLQSISDTEFRLRLILPVSVAAGSAFAAVTCLSTSFRGKDDEWNYWWGGVAAGCFAGIRCKSSALFVVT